WASMNPGPMRVVPVVAIGPGLRSPVALSRLAHLASTIKRVASHQLVDPLEVWLIDGNGDPDVWRPGDEAPPAGRGTAAAKVALLGAVVAEAEDGADLI